jgi:tRNA threonylcarbamoyladenosine biosynthesis protein TsaE
MPLHAIRQLDSPDATAAFAVALAHVLRPGDVVALAGDLGAGKTTLVRDLASAMGVPSNLVHSPTFVMVNEYPARIHANANARLVHIDAYRLHASDELDTLGWDTFMDIATTDAAGRPLAARKDAVVVIEWAQRIMDALPAPELLARIALTPTSEDAREVTLDLPDSWLPRPGAKELLERDPTRCRATRKWVAPTSKTYPFADDRARLADLGKWFGEGFTVARDIEPDDVEE